MKKNRNKLILGLVLIGFLIIVVVISSLKKREEKGSDYKIGILGDDGIAMVSMSRDRQMINFLSVSSDSQIWIPGGMGWYRNQVIKKILTQEKKTYLVKNILFYNFGFVVDKVVMVTKTTDWQQKFWWRFLGSNNLIKKTENLEGDVDKNEAFLDKIMPRDFSETKVVNDDLKLSIINSSNVDGLANFMTKQLERAGFSVVSVTDGDDLDKCKLSYGQEVEKTFSWKILKSLFDCQIESDASLNEGEVEIYLGKSFSEVIKYPTYKK